MHAYADAAQGRRAVKPADATPPVHATAALMDRRPAGIAQRALSAAMHEQPRLRQLQTYQDMANGAARSNLPLQRMGGNHVGLPAKLKTGMEGLSGFSLDDVKVHYNSDKPAQLQAHAYAQGSDIHLAAGQEKHLPHEAWHVVQQKQGRVRPTLQMKGGVPVNDDRALELEADIMGSKALQLRAGARAPSVPVPAMAAGVVQGYFMIDSNPSTTVVPREYHQGEIQARKLNKVLAAWATDDIPHVYASWDDAVADLVRMDKEKNAIGGALPTDRAQFDSILDSYHSDTSAVSPVLLDAINNRFASLASMLGHWQYEAQWLREFALVAQSLSRLLDEAVRLHEQAPIPEEQQQMSPSSAKGDEQFDPIAHEQLPHLHDIPERLSTPMTGLGRDERHKAIGVIRGTDNDEFMQTDGSTAEKHGAYVKGAILAPFIRDNRKALLGLVHMMGDATAVFSLERGGSLVADHLHALGRDIMNIKIAKTEERTSQHRNLAMAMMDLEEGRMFTMLSRNPLLLKKPPLITIALTETAISGSSVNTLLKTISQYHHLLPQSQFRLLIERQTIKEERLRPERTGGIHVEDPGIDLEKNLVTSAIPKVQMFISHAQYILGEDVDYQISYDGKHTGQPLMIFDESKKQIVAVSLSSPTMTPRDMIMRMIGGAYDATLAQTFDQF